MPDGMAPLSISLVRSGTTSAQEPLPSSLPALAAFPNPFNPATRVAFELPVGGAVKLDIVDLRGRLVTTLHDGTLPAGRHALEWRGRDRSGRAVPGGVYLARLITAQGLRTTKLALAKSSARPHP